MRKIDDDMLDMLMATSGPQPKPPYYKARSISASNVGTECDAALAFTLRGFPEAPNPEKRERLFELGKVIEPMVIAHMKGVGLAVIEIDPSTGRQFYCEEREGHVKAYLDGYVAWDDEDLEPLETKSMNAERFKKLNKKIIDGMPRQAALKLCEPKYYDQVQCIIWLAKTESAVFIAYSKSDSQYLAIRVAKDEDRIRYLEAKIDRVLEGNVSRITATPKTSFTCGLCPHREQACTSKPGSVVPVIDLGCHHCKYSTPDEDRKWWCTKHLYHPTHFCSDFEPWEPKP